MIGVSHANAIYATRRPNQTQTEKPDNTCSNLNNYVLLLVKTKEKKKISSHRRTRRVKSLKVTMIHKILEHYIMYSIFNKLSAKCLNCVLCFITGQTQTKAGDPTTLKLSGIELLPTFKLKKRKIVNIYDVNRSSVTDIYIKRL